MQLTLNPPDNLQQGSRQTGSWLELPLQAGRKVRLLALGRLAGHSPRSAPPRPHHNIDCLVVAATIDPAALTAAARNIKEARPRLKVSTRTLLTFAGIIF